MNLLIKLISLNLLIMFSEGSYYFPGDRWRHFGPGGWEYFDYCKWKEDKVECTENVLANNSECISLSQLCDGRRDCNNSIDEEDCWCRGETCYNCQLLRSNNSTQLIPQNKERCNYFLQAFGYTYISNGTPPNSTLGNKCVMCDGDIQCYQPFSKRHDYSEIEEYDRIGGYSILGKHHGRRETQEQKHFHDEMNCTCPPKLPKPCNCQENDNCQNNGFVCYNDSMRCNNTAECIDYTDEAGCKCNHKTEHRCTCFDDTNKRCPNPGSNRDRTCIPINKTQNCEINCPDWSDEQASFKHKNYNIKIKKENSCTASGCSVCYQTSLYHCPDNKPTYICGSSSPSASDRQMMGFQCEDGRLISADQYCDGKKDCWDGSDENTKEEGFLKGFLCSGHGKKLCVLPQRNLYDEVGHCSDGLDSCRPNDRDKCFYKCFDQNEQMYVAKSQMCDQVFNCPDSSDECLCDDSLSLRRCQDIFKKKSSQYCSNLDLTKANTHENEEHLKEANMIYEKVSVTTLIEIFMIIIFSANGCVLLSMFALTKIGLTREDRYQFAIIFQICICDFIKGFSLLYYMIISSRYKHSDEDSAGYCSLFGNFVVTATEASCFLLLWLSWFRRYHISEKQKMGVTRRLWISIGAGIWVTSLFIGFSPGIFGYTDFFSEGIWFRHKYTSTVISNKVEIQKFACRLEILSQNQTVQISDWNTAKQFLKNYNPKYSFPGAFDDIGNINICLFNFFLPYESNVRAYTLLFAAVNLIIYCICFILTVVGYRKFLKEWKSKMREASNLQNQPGTSVSLPYESIVNHIEQKNNGSITDEAVDSVYVAKNIQSFNDVSATTSSINESVVYDVKKELPSVSKLNESGAKPEFQSQNSQTMEKQNSLKDLDNPNEKINEIVLSQNENQENSKIYRSVNNINEKLHNGCQSTDSNNEAAINNNETTTDSEDTPKIVPIFQKNINYYVICNVLFWIILTVLFCLAYSNAMVPSFLYIFLAVFFCFIGSITNPFFVLMQVARMFFWLFFESDPVSEEESERRLRHAFEVLLMKYDE